MVFCRPRYPLTQVPLLDVDGDGSISFKEIASHVKLIAWLKADHLSLG